MEGAKSPLDIFPVDLRHRLWLQTCFDALGGLGQDEDLTLENEEQRGYRMDWFIRCLRKHRDSVQHLDLTLDDLLTKVVMPSRDEKVFVQIVMDRLGLTSTQERLADFL